VEKDGREYIFISIDEFKRWIAQGQFVEYAEVYGNFYGTVKKSLEAGLSAGYHILMDVDVQGARELMNLYPDGVFIYIMPPDIAELQRRLKKRDTDHDEVIRKRLAKARQELEYKDDYKYTIENRELEATVVEILSIIEREIGRSPDR
jgi:guanylate kinase